MILARITGSVVSIRHLEGFLYLTQHLRLTDHEGVHPGSDAEEVPDSLPPHPRIRVLAIVQVGDAFDPVHGFPEELVTLGPGFCEAIELRSVAGG